MKKRGGSPGGFNRIYSIVGISKRNVPRYWTRLNRKIVNKAYRKRNSFQAKVVLPIAVRRRYPKPSRIHFMWMKTEILFVTRIIRVTKADLCLSWIGAAAFGWETLISANAKFPLEKNGFNCIIKVRTYLRKLLRSGGPSSNNGTFYYSCTVYGRRR